MFVLVLLEFAIMQKTLQNKKTVSKRHDKIWKYIPSYEIPCYLSVF